MLVVTRPTGSPAQAAPNAGGRASVVVPLGEPGVYRVQVVSSRPGPGGPYSIAVQPASATTPVTVPVSSSHQLTSLAPAQDGGGHQSSPLRSTACSTRSRRRS